jgi:hypothetical protein
MTRPGLVRGRPACYARHRHYLLTCGELAETPIAARTDEQGAYLASAWYHRFDLSLRDEPVGATEVWGRWDTLFRRQRGGWYDPRRHAHVSWRELWRVRGPHLVVTRAEAG